MLGGSESTSASWSANAAGNLTEVAEPDGTGVTYASRTAAGTSRVTGNGNGHGNGHGPDNGDTPCAGDHGDHGDHGAVANAPPATHGDGVKSYQESPDYLLAPIAHATYTYDAVGNRTSLTTDLGTTTYSYDKANRLLSAGTTQYSYDAAGNQITQVGPNGEVDYTYNAAGKLTKVALPDGSGVTYAYDALGRKVERTESDWALRGGGPGAGHGGQGDGADQSSAGDQGNGKDNGLGNGGTHVQGKDAGSTAADAGDHGHGSDKGAGNTVANGNSGSCGGDVGATHGTDASASHGGDGHGSAHAQAHKRLKLRNETTRYSYDGLSLNVLNEYTGQAAPKAAYYYANGQVLGRKMFGLKGQDLVQREPGLANGGTYYYLTDGLGSVTELADQQGALASRYRYDAFGGLFTGIIGPYNTMGLTGKSYDPKSGLMDFAARWYAPQVGRFTQADTFKGFLSDPVTQNLFAYVGNNPVNRMDPTGHYVAADPIGGGGTTPTCDPCYPPDTGSTTTTTTDPTGSTGTTSTPSTADTGSTGTTGSTSSTSSTSADSGYAQCLSQTSAYYCNGLYYGFDTGTSSSNTGSTGATGGGTSGSSTSSGTTTPTPTTTSTGDSQTPGDTTQTTTTGTTTPTGTSTDTTSTSPSGNGTTNNSSAGTSSGGNTNGSGTAQSPPPSTPTIQERMHQAYYTLLGYGVAPQTALEQSLNPQSHDTLQDHVQAMQFAYGLTQIDGVQVIQNNHALVYTGIFDGLRIMLWLRLATAGTWI